MHHHVVHQHAGLANVLRLLLVAQHPETLPPPQFAFGHMMLQSPLGWRIDVIVRGHTNAVTYFGHVA